MKKRAHPHLHSFRNVSFGMKKRAHPHLHSTYGLAFAVKRIENFVGAHPVLMRAFAGLDMQQPSVIQSEATVREQSEESRHEHG